MSRGVDGALQTEELGDAIAGLVRAFGLHQPERTPCGQPVPVSEAHALMELSGNGPLVQGELARRLRLEKSTVSRLVDKLDRRGWIRREPSASDGRALTLHLTRTGRAAAQRLAEARRTRFGTLLAAIPQAERGAVLQALHTLTGALDDRA